MPRCCLNPLRSISIYCLKSRGMYIICLFRGTCRDTSRHVATRVATRATKKSNNVDPWKSTSSAPNNLVTTRVRDTVSKGLLFWKPVTRLSTINGLFRKTRCLLTTKPFLKSPPPVSKIHADQTQPTKHPTRSGSSALCSPASPNYICFSPAILVGVLACMRHTSRHTPPHTAS